MKGLKTVGVREFREDLATHLQSDEPIAVTRHGQAVGVFIPIEPERAKAIWSAIYKAAAPLDALLEQYGITEDEAVEEFERLRRESRQAGR